MVGIVAPELKHPFALPLDPFGRETVRFPYVTEAEEDDVPDLLPDQFRLLQPLFDDGLEFQTERRPVFAPEPVEHLPDVGQAFADRPIRLEAEFGFREGMEVLCEVVVEPPQPLIPDEGEDVALIELRVAGDLGRILIGSAALVEMREFVLVGDLRVRVRLGAIPFEQRTEADRSGIEFRVKREQSFFAVGGEGGLRFFALARVFGRRAYAVFSSSSVRLYRMTTIGLRFSASFPPRTAR